jgi:hypothetical protein
MWTVVLLMLWGPIGSAEPMSREIPMPSVEACIEQVTQLMALAQAHKDDGNTFYSAGCQLNPVGRPA